MRYAWHIGTLVLLACAGALCPHLLAAPWGRPATALSQPFAKPGAPSSTASVPDKEPLDVADFGHPPIRVYKTPVVTGVYDIAFDTKGYVWAATNDGVAAFNGREWKTVELPDQTYARGVYRVLPSRDGGVWLARLPGRRQQYGDDVSFEHGLMYVGEAPAGARPVVDASSELPGDLVGTMIETIDEAGVTTLWVGTNRGLARLRQGEWTTFGLRGPPHNAVTSLLETAGLDGTRTLWVGTLNAGLARYERGDWTYFDSSSGLPNDSVLNRGLLASKDGSGAIWVATAGGVACYRDGAWTAFGSDAWGNQDAPPSCIGETLDRDGASLWVGTGNGLARYHSGKWTFFSPEAVGMLGTLVTRLLGTVDEAGVPTLWVGTGGGLVRYRKGIWTIFSAATSDVESAVQTIEEHVSRDGAHEIWVGLFGSGVMRLTRLEWTIVDRTSGMYTDQTSVNTQVRHILEATADDGSQVMWMEMNRGIVRYEMGVWTRFTIADLPKGFMGVMAAVEPESGTGSVLWLATPDGPVSYERGVFTRVRLSADPRQNRVGSVLRSKDGRGLWAITAGGVARYENGRFTFVGDTSGPRSQVRAICESDDGTVYFGTAGGLVRRRNGQQTVFDASSGLPSDDVRHVAETTTRGGGRTTWIATAAGVARLDGEQIAACGTDSGLPNSRITVLESTTDADGCTAIWVGTWDAGIAWLDVDDPSGRWLTLSDTTTPALPTYRVNSLCKDRRDRIYVVTNEGVARLTRRAPTADDPCQYSVYNFTSGNVLRNNFSNEAMVDSKGRIWVSNARGAMVLDPSKEVEDRTADPLYVERASLEGSTDPLAEGAALSYDQNAIGFEYALVSYSDPAVTRYRTRLVGFDDELSAWTPDAQRGYTNLPSGDYAFEVWARDDAGNVSGPAEFRFTIRPAPWRSWWAYALYTLLVVAAAYVAMQYRVRALTRHSRELEGLVAARTAELAVSEQRALAASTAKSTFLANMSHELRTPLNAVLGFAELLTRGPSLGGEQRRHLSIITKSGEHLLHLIDDVLSIAKIEAGKVTIAEAAFDLRRLLEAVEAMIRAGAEAKGLTVVADLDAGVPRAVVGDEGKLEEVLLNLLGNGVKFTARGSVTLRTRWEDDRAFFEVEDTGVGISPDEMGTLFDAFVQTESGRRAAEGTGLGLAISRQLVRLMGGDITVRSQLGRGTVFSFDVRLARAAETASEPEDRRVIGLAAGQAAPRVLVVDDTEESRVLLATLLGSVRVEVREAGNGEEAIEAWEVWHPELIFMDVRMPVMDGQEATRRIREQEGEGERVKIVVLSASAFAHEREEILATGADDFVTKPYREATIFEKLTEHLGVQFEHEERMGEEPASPQLSRAIGPERFAVWPVSEVEALAGALRNGNDVAAARIVARQRALDEELAAEVTERLKTFDFDEILTAMGRT